MKENAYKGAETVPLYEYLPVNMFRTILPELRKLSWGAREIPVIIELSRNSRLYSKSLPDYFKNAMYIYGYVKMNARLEEVFGCGSESGTRGMQIFMHEWDNKFLMLFMYNREPVGKPVFVAKQEVAELMINALHPNIY
ncbi:MAG: hypothetical protein AB7C97_01055 [Oscillospiraceae bacterium]